MHGIVWHFSLSPLIELRPDPTYPWSVKFENESLCLLDHGICYRVMTSVVLLSPDHTSSQARNETINSHDLKRWRLL